MMEAKAFLADVFDYDYHNEYHRDTAQDILRILDTEDNGLIKFARVKQFFELPNFIQISKLEAINSLDAIAMA